MRGVTAERTWRHILTAAVFALASAHAAPATGQTGGAPANQVVVTEAAGRSYAAPGYPLQFGRVFAQGEISGEPDVLAGGVSVQLQQAAVKTRWEDGSAKYAIVCLRLPLSARQTVTLTFRDRPASSPTPLTAAQMLATDFDATIRLASGGNSASASARSMLQAGHYSVWFGGPVATSVILADHSAARTYDMGFTGRRPFRPIFHATFWPGWGVQLRAIGESANTEENQTVTADTLVTIGRSNPQVLVNETGVNHLSHTRWSRTGWIAATPGPININYGADYLAAVKALPNFDATLKVPESQVASLYAKYQSLNKSLYAQTNDGSWHAPMDDVGGRADLGPFPMWYMAWLFSGDWRMREYVEFLSSQYGSLVNQHFREGSSRPFHDGVNGLGRVLSIEARPTVCLWYSDNVYEGGTGADRPTYFAPYSRTGVLRYDAEHVPHPYPIPYLLTGDFFFLEQLWFAASTELAWIPSYYRGPTGKSGGLYWSYGRIVATTGVARFEAAYFSPDGTPEKAYFTEKSHDMVKMFDGLNRLTASPHVGDPLYEWGATEAATGGNGLYRLAGGAVSPLGWYSAGYLGHTDVVSNPAVLTVSPWIQAYMVYGLGRAADLGFDTRAGVRFLTKPFIDMVVNGRYPSHVGIYQYPVRRSDTTGDGYYATWAAATQDLRSTLQSSIPINTTDFDHSYHYVALMAASFGTAHPSFSQAWTWYMTQIYAPLKSNGLSGVDAKWAIMPRKSSATVVSAPTNLRIVAP